MRSQLFETRENSSGLKTITIFAKKNSILDFGQSPEHTSAKCHDQL